MSEHACLPARHAILASMTCGTGAAMTARHHPGGTRDGPPGGDAGPASPGPVARARQAAGSELRRRRVAAGLTQAELGNRIGYARTTIGEAETRAPGRRRACGRPPTPLAAAAS